ncbi:MAG: ArsA family ATPase [Dehalococcoidia bacterium]
MRIILYTGKGGVGKTSVAAATALLTAEAGYRTMVMSTDTAHSLADSFDILLGPEGVQIAPNLWGQEVDVFKELSVHWKTIQEWLAALMRWQGMDEVMAEELAILPGMEELVALLYVTQYSRQQEWDVLIVDCAPTGETLRLLSFPDMARWYMHRLFPLEKKVAAAIGPVARGILHLPIPDQRVFDSIQDLYTQLEEMRQLLLNPETASVRLVVNPEKMVIKEAQRTFTYLNLYGYHTDLVVCNRVLPQAAGDGFFHNWRVSQGKHIKLIEEVFSPLPILQAPLLDREAVGVEALQELGEAIFTATDPTQVFYHGQAQEVVREGRNLVLKVQLPFASREEVSVLESGDEVVVQVGRYRRNILLPRVLVGSSVQEATLEGDTLRLTFSPKARARKE